MLDGRQVPMLLAALALVGVAAACALGPTPSDASPTADPSDRVFADFTDHVRLRAALYAA